MSMLIGKIGAVGGFFVGGPFGALGGGLLGTALGFFGGQYMGEKLFEYLLGGNVSENDLIPKRPKVTESGHRGRIQLQKQREYDERFGTSDENPIPDPAVNVSQRDRDAAKAGTLRSKLEAEGYIVDPTQTGMNINELSRSIERLKSELLRTVGLAPQSVNNIDASTNSNTSNMNIGSTSVQNQNYAVRHYAALGGAGL